MFCVSWSEGQYGRHRKSEVFCDMVDARLFYDQMERDYTLNYIRLEVIGGS